MRTSRTTFQVGFTRLFKVHPLAAPLVRRACVLLVHWRGQHAFWLMHHVKPGVSPHAWLPVEELAQEEDQPASWSNSTALDWQLFEHKIETWLGPGTLTRRLNGACCGVELDASIWLLETSQVSP